MPLVRRPRGKGVDEGEESSRMWHVNRKAVCGHGGVEYRV